MATRPTLKRSLSLADALAREFRTEEAIELYWRAFDRTNDLDGKLRRRLSAVRALPPAQPVRPPAACGSNASRPEPGRERESTLYLAQAQAAAGDFGTARQQLEDLLAADPRDTTLLKQLSELAENEGDLGAATQYQKQLQAVAPSGEAAYRLVQLALRAGALEEAEAVWSHSTEAGQDMARVLQALDGLMSHHKYEAVLTTTARLLRKDPNNWELLCREGRALMALDRPDEGTRRFQALLELRRDDDEVSATIKAQRSARPSTAAQGAGTAAAGLIPTWERVGMRHRIPSVRYARAITGLEPGYPSSIIDGWGPPEFGQARLVALGFLLARARREGREDAFRAQVQQACELAPNDTRPYRDAFYVELLRSEPRTTYEAARALARVAEGELSAAWRCSTPCPIATTRLASFACGP